MEEEEEEEARTELSLGQDMAFSPTALRGPSPFPPIWRIWPDAADFGIRRRHCCDSPVSPFPQNFPTPSSPQLDRSICTGRLADQGAVLTKGKDTILIDWIFNFAYFWHLLNSKVT